MHVLKRSRLIAGALLVLLLAACSQDSSAVVPTVTPNVTATPIAPTGDYAFIRTGDLWVHLGNAPSHSLTELHLGEASAMWGSLAWSPDHTILAFVLNSPPIAPGYVATNPVQSTGTLFLADVATGKLTTVPGAGAVPVIGRHVAWFSDAGTPAIVFTQGGGVETYHPGAAKATPLSTPQHVWEVATRGSTLFYTRAANIQPTGTAIGELHALNLLTATDVTIAQLGNIQLPAQICSNILCPPDTTTPAVPYAWSVNGDGSLVVYESAQPDTTISGATPTPGGKATPTPTLTKIATPVVGTPTATPPAVPSHFYVAQHDGTGARIIFAQLPAATTTVTWQLALSPDGNDAVLSVSQPTIKNYGPFVQALAANGALQSDAQATLQLGGAPSWAPNSQGFTLTAVGTGDGPQNHALVTFLLNGQSTTTEDIGDDLVWGE